MSGAEGVELRLVAAREAAEASVGAYGVEPLAAACDDLVSIGLMAHVPDELVVGGVEDIVEREGKFDGAEAGSQMAGMSREGVDNILAQLVGEGRQVGD